MTADGELMMTLLAVFSQQESQSISSNIKWVIQKKFERGETWHTAPFGYRWNGETFLVQNEEANAVRRIYADFLADVPLSRIAGSCSSACSIPLSSGQTPEAAMKWSPDTGVCMRAALPGKTRSGG